jgi:hypothetical protein
MNREEAWARCPLELANAALRIARQYGEPWALSQAIPSGDELWKPEDARPSLRRIEDAIPEGDLIIATGHLDVYLRERTYYVIFNPPVPNPYIVVSKPVQGKHVRYQVKVRRARGGVAWGEFVGDRLVRSRASVSAWGEDHVLAWNIAWETLGIKPPPFPGVLRAWRFDYMGEWPENPESLRYATVMIPTSAYVALRDLLWVMSYADNVTIVDDVGGKHPLAVRSSW